MFAIINWYDITIIWVKTLVVGYAPTLDGLTDRSPCYLSTPDQTF